MRLDDVSTERLQDETLDAIRRLERAKNADVETEVAEALQLAPEDREARIANGTMTKLGYRIAWRRTQLRREGLIVKAGHGIWGPPNDLGPVQVVDHEPKTIAAFAAAAAPIVPWHRLSIGELLLADRQVVRELRRRRIIRGKGAVVGDLAEWLVAQAYDGTLAPPAQRAHDVTLADGTRLQVKARVVSAAGGVGERQLGTIAHHDYEILIGILFDDEDVTVYEGLEIPRALVELYGAERNGTFTVHLNTATIEALLKDGAIRITDQLRAAAEALADPPGAPAATEPTDGLD